MATKYVVVFHWTGEGFLHEKMTEMRPLLESMYVTFYNEYANYANDHLDEWNRKADLLEYSADEYNAYMWLEHDRARRKTLEKLKLIDLGEGFKQEYYLDDEMVLHYKIACPECDTWTDVMFRIKEAA